MIAINEDLETDRKIDQARRDEDEICWELERAAGSAEHKRQQLVQVLAWSFVVGFLFGKALRFLVRRERQLRRSIEAEQLERDRAFARLVAHRVRFGELLEDADRPMGVDHDGE